MRAPVGQQCDASVGVGVRGRHAVGCEPKEVKNRRADARVPFLSYRQTVLVLSSSLAASGSTATRFAAIALRP